MTRIVSPTLPSPAVDLIDKINGQFATILSDPPWQFQNRTGKVAPEHRRLLRYPTMELQEILDLPVGNFASARSHLYLWVPNALLMEGLRVMKAWGFTYKANIVWSKIRKDGGPDGRGVGFYFRNVTELILFGVRGNMRTLKPGRTQVNMLATRKREHSRTRRNLRDHRIMFPGSILGTVCPFSPQRLGAVGQRRCGAEYTAQRSAAERSH